jgi:pyruvate ferredoxin oxidoreductase gamma subunit
MSTSEMIDIRWHGRGGQGTVTAAKLTAEVALTQGKYFQASPEYGPERMGAPIRAFTRISSEPIELHCNTNPNIVAVLDSTLLGTVNITEGMSKGNLLIINTEQPPEKIKSTYNLEDYKVVTVDASRIAKETIGKDIPNAPMLGAIAKVTGVIDSDKAEEHIRKSFEKKKFSSEIIEGNVKAFRRAMQEVKLS